MTPTIVKLTPLSVTAVPTTCGSPPNRLCQSPWLNSATRSLPALSSSAVKPRPTRGLTPRRVGRLALTRAPEMRSGRSPSARLNATLAKAAIWPNELFCSCQLRKSLGVDSKCGNRGSHFSSSIINLSGSRNGSGLSKTAWTTLKMAVFAPIPQREREHGHGGEGGVLQELAEGEF